jgi:hypothetical protein
MKCVAVSDQRTLRDVIGKGVKKDVVVERDGHAVALIVPFDDDDRYWYAREHDAAFIRSIAKARQQMREGKSVSHEELKARLCLK